LPFPFGEPDRGQNFWVVFGNGFFGEGEVRGGDQGATDFALFDLDVGKIGEDFLVVDVLIFADLNDAFGDVFQNKPFVCPLGRWVLTKGNPAEIFHNQTGGAGAIFGNTDGDGRIYVAGADFSEVFAGARDVGAGKEREALVFDGAKEFFSGFKEGTGAVDWDIFAVFTYFSDAQMVGLAKTVGGGKVVAPDETVDSTKGGDGNHVNLTKIGVVDFGPVESVDFVEELGAIVAEIEAGFANAKSQANGVIFSGRTWVLIAFTVLIKGTDGASGHFLGTEKMVVLGAKNGFQGHGFLREWERRLDLTKNCRISLGVMVETNLERAGRLGWYMSTK